MNQFAVVVMLAWIPVVLWLHAKLPAPRAQIVSFLAAWLFLPVVKFPLSGLPDYTKTSATTFGVMLGTALFHRERLSAVRLGWFDLPMIVWCLCAFVSSITNDLGVYDGLSGVLTLTIIWGFPYLIGRACFGDAAGQRKLALGIVAGGLIYVPLCLWESRMSPQLHRTLYGSTPGTFENVHRFDGFRPIVFLSNGLELGMWMTATTLLGLWLWWSRTVRKIGPVPFGPLVGLMVVTAVLCRSTGALILMLAGLAVLAAVGRLKSSALVWALILAAPLYMALRGGGHWSGDELVEFTRNHIDEGRASSLEYRMFNENLFVRRAWERIVFGWGGWDRFNVYGEDSPGGATPDGLWVVALGQKGVVGLASLFGAMGLPLLLVALRYPAKSWRRPEVAPTAGLAVIVTLYQLDCLSNGMINPIYAVAIGGALGYLGSRPTLHDDPPSESLLGGRDDAFAGPWGAAEAAPAEAGIGCDPGAAHEVLLPALDERQRALEHWAGRVAESPGDPEPWRHWLDSHNDLAWFLANECEPGTADPALAVRLAEWAVEQSPECATYWNTLGVAYYRAGDWDAAIAALERSVELSGPAVSGLDCLFLALAHARRGEPGPARTWYELAAACPDAHAPECLRDRAEAEALLAPGRELLATRGAIEP
jgi:hypothetical protein